MSRPIITDEALEGLLTLPARLEALSLHLGGERCGTKATMASCVWALPALRRIKLSGDPFSFRLRLWDNVVTALPDSCPLLEVVHLNYIRPTDKDLIKLGQLCYLKEFRLSCSDDVTDRGIEAICNGRGCIQKLGLDSVRNLTNVLSRILQQDAPFTSI